jgi:YD repeat-containing protein
MNGVSLMPKSLLFATVFLAASCQAPMRNAEAQQTRVYDARGNSVGTSTPQGDGSTRFYDTRGRSLGTSSTAGGTTNFYDARGNRTGSMTPPTGGRQR